MTDSLNVRNARDLMAKLEPVAPTLVKIVVHPRGMHELRKWFGSEFELPVKSLYQVPILTDYDHDEGTLSGFMSDGSIRTLRLW